MKRHRHSNRGTRWIHAKYPGLCRCGRRIRPGDRAIFVVASKKLSCCECGRLDVMRISDDDLNAVLKVR